jgi:Cu(I)/Ag(I) efflux system membrane fusion protein
MRMTRRVARAAAVCLVALSAVAIWYRAYPPPENDHAAEPGAAAGAHYQCAMHPQIVSDRPGTCPICQMKLQRVDDGARPVADASPRTPLFYRHPMRADVVSSVPAQDEMGMAYVPVYEETAPPEESDVPGHASFTLSRERQQLIGVSTDVVERRDLAVDIRAAGRVAYDPKLYQAVVEYREALRSRGALRGGLLGDSPSAGDAILRGARSKLLQQGLSDDLIEAFVKRGSDPGELLLPGASVWIYAQVYEYEAALVAPGQAMTVTAPSLPGASFATTITAVDSIVDPMTRTLRVRGLLATPERNLRPESFVQVTIRVPLGEQLAVPEDAVLDTGDHRIVFVVHDDGTFEPRSVDLGRAARGYYEVQGGLRAGERVVTTANFLVDSESRFRAALAAFRRAAAPAR